MSFPFVSLSQQKYMEFLGRDYGDLEGSLYKGCDHSGNLNLKLFVSACGMQVYEFNNSLLLCLSIIFGIHCKSTF